MPEDIYKKPEFPEEEFGMTDSLSDDDGTTYSLNNGQIVQGNEWQLAYNFVQYTGLNLFLTGKAGTGKTTFLQKLRTSCSKRMIVVAPTGVAAINAGGVTIHSFFQLAMGPQIPDSSLGSAAVSNNLNSPETVTDTTAEGLIKTSNSFSKRDETARQSNLRREKINIIRSLDLLIIDEISMVRADLLDAVDKVLRQYRRNSKPFGGVQLLMIGDLQQLPPVVRHDEWEVLKYHYDTSFFFGSHVLLNSSYITIELNKVFRQQDDNFVTVLNKIRDGKPDAETLDILNSRYIENFNPPDKEGYITLTTHNDQAKAINDRKLSEIKSKTFTYDAVVEGEFPDSSFPTESALQLKKGAQVMFIKNDNTTKLFYNGKVGIVTALGKELVEVTCKGDYAPITVTPMQWSNVRYNINSATNEITEESIGTFSQLPLKPAWAITIHKSQGLTFDKVIIDAHSAFAHGQVYVALSRCRSIEGIVLSSKLSYNEVINNDLVKDFQDRAISTRPTEEDLSSAKKEFHDSRILDLFNFTDLLIAVRRIKKNVIANKSILAGEPETVFTDMERLTSEEIVTVADRFAIQLRQLFRKSDTEEGKKQLQERIISASLYFITKIVDTIVSKVETPCYETDNKDVRSLLRDDSERILSETTVKLACLRACNKGFDIQKHLKVKALASIEPARIKKTASQIENDNNNPNKELIRALRRWRNDTAENADVEVYMVISVKAIEELAAKQPLSKKELLKIKGIGKKKVEQFGDEILSIISRYAGKPIEETKQKSNRKH